MGALQEELYGCDDADYDNWYDRERINSKDAAWDGTFDGCWEY